VLSGTYVQHTIVLGLVPTSRSVSFSRTSTSVENLESVSWLALGQYKTNRLDANEVVHLHFCSKQTKSLQVT
jgi:hypothetical protein